MQRISGLVITASMAVVAFSLGAMLHLALGLALSTAAALSMALLVLMVLQAERDQHARERSAFEARLSELERVAESLIGNVEPPDLEPRARAVAETVCGSMAEHLRHEIGVELGAFGGRIAALRDRLDSIEACEASDAGSVPAALPAAMPEPQPVERPLVARADDRLIEPPAGPAPAATAPEAAFSLGTRSLADLKAEAAPRRLRPAPAPQAEPLDEAGAVRDAVRRAVAAGRIELHLQPAVTLPQRRTRWYETLARLRLDDGRLLAPQDWMPAAREAGLCPVIDQTGVFRAVQIARRLSVRHGDLGLFCNLFGETLADGDVLPDFLGFLEANAELGKALTFEIAQDDVKRFGPIEIEALKAIAERGFGFSLDRTRDLRVDFPELAAHGFRFVKVPSDVLLTGMESAGAEIHAADLSDLLARYGLTLIATEIESEGTVVDLLDYDLRFGQGYLFSRPRPVRPDILATPARGDLQRPLAQAAE